LHKGRQRLDGNEAPLIGRGAATQAVEHRCRKNAVPTCRIVVGEAAFCGSSQHHLTPGPLDRLDERTPEGRLRLRTDRPLFRQPFAAGVEQHELPRRAGLGHLFEQRRHPHARVFDVGPHRIRGHQVVESATRETVAGNDHHEEPPRSRLPRLTPQQPVEVRSQGPLETGARVAELAEPDLRSLLLRLPCEREHHLRRRDERQLEDEEVSQVDRVVDGVGDLGELRVLELPDPCEKSRRWWPLCLCARLWL